MKIKNVFISVLIMTIMISSICYANDDIVVSIDKNVVDFVKQPILIKDNVIMLPIEEVLTNMNINWRWESDEKTFIASYEEKEYVFTLDANKYSINNVDMKLYAQNTVKKTLDTSFLKLNNTAMMSAEDIGNCFNYDVEYLDYRDTLELKKIKNYKIKDIINHFSVTIAHENQIFEKPMFVIDDEIYVPLNEFLDKLRIPYIINWDASYRYESSLDHYDSLIYVNTDEKEVFLVGETTKNENGIIPDKETAYNVGKELLEKYAGREMEYTTGNGSFYLRTYYLPRRNAWRIDQVYRTKSGKDSNYGCKGPFICLNKNTGEVLSIATYLHDKAK